MDIFIDKEYTVINIGLTSVPVRRDTADTAH